MNHSEIFFKVESLSKTFPAEQAFTLKRAERKTAFENINLNIYEGEILGLIGESGSGKTTLGRCLIRLLKTDSGSIVHQNRDLLQISKSEFKKHRPKFQMIFQHPGLALNPMHTIENILAEPLKVVRPLPKNEIRSRTARLIQLAGLEEQLLKRRPCQLSGGQQQRAAIARALAADPVFLIADEPVSSLDASFKKQIIDLLVDIHKKMGMTLLLISHDMSVIRYAAQRIAVMYKGRIAELGPAAELLGQPLHPYTIKLIKASQYDFKSSDMYAPAVKETKSSFEHGCTFYMHCYKSRERCRQEKPPLLSVSAGRKTACFFTDD